MELAQARKARVVSRPGGRILADALVAQGIDHVFSVPGESFLDTLDGLYAVRQKLRLATCRFEAGAVNMAEAYGKLTGRPAAAFVTRGPGACHGAIGAHIAMQDSTPLLLFVGQIPFEETDRESFQEIDYRRMFAPIAKWVTQIDEAKRIPEIVAHAVDVATSGRPGPVVIALSEEMQRHTAEVPDLGRVPVARPHPDPAAIDRLMATLARARRPLAVLGGSTWSAQGRAAIREFLLGNNLPVATGFRRQALYDGTLPNFAGDLGVGADPALVAKAREADLVLAIGTRLGEPVTQGYTLFDMAGGTPIVHVYPDGAEIGRVFRPALGIVADLDAFAVAVAGRDKLRARWSSWTEDLRGLREAQRAVVPYAGPLNLAQAMRDLEGLLHAGRHTDHGRRKFCRLADAVPELLRTPALHRPDQRGDGLQRPRRGRRQDRLPGAHGGGVCRRWRLPDDRPGDRDRVPPRRCAHRAAVQQRDVRHGAYVSGARLSGPRLGYGADQPRLRPI